MTWAVPLAALALSGCAPAILVGSGATLTRSVVQERPVLAGLNDLETELSIATRMSQHSGELYRDVAVDVVEGRVVLTGSVPRREDRITAERIAWKPEGVVSVDNAITVAEDSGTRAYLQDARISNVLRFKLLRDTSVASVNLSVETVDRTVHLTGLARSPAEMERAIAHARQVEGVKRVVSHVLLIDDPRRIAARPGNPPV
ncbi:MAG: BON domain-containing protein [Pseudomonadota bacterium]